MGQCCTHHDRGVRDRSIEVYQDCALPTLLINLYRPCRSTSRMLCQLTTSYGLSILWPSRIQMKPPLPFPQDRTLSLVSFTMMPWFPRKYHSPKTRSRFRFQSHPPINSSHHPHHSTIHHHPQSLLTSRRRPQDKPYSLAALLPVCRRQSAVE